MYYVDYHTHSKNSFDGYETVEDMAKRARETGLREICITDHYECSYDHVPMKFGFEDTKVEIAALGGNAGIMVRYGIEIGQMHVEPDVCRRIIERNDFDFIIGSVHNITGDLDLYYVDYTKKRASALFEEYLCELQKLASTADYDVIGHITYPLRYMARDGVSFDLAPYADKIDSILKTVIERKKGIEVNASGLRQEIGDTMPPIEIVRRYRELGGKIITVGSDAHRCRDIGSGIPEAVDIVCRAGFSEITVFEKRRPRYIKITD